MVTLLPFIDDGDRPLGRLYDEGLDGRLYTALHTMRDLATPPPLFVRTRCPDLLDRKKVWSIDVGGLVHEPRSIGLAELQALSGDDRLIVMECAGNAHHGAFGLLGAASFRGAPLARVLDMVRPTERARQVLIRGFDEHSQPPKTYSMAGTSWIFPLEALRANGAMLALGMNGDALSEDYGGPVRLVVPGWYGCTCVKWVDAIELVDEHAEATAHMKLYASRTHQDGVPALAREFEPALIDFSALPIRVEERPGELRIVGLVWGNDATTERLLIRLSADGPFETVSGYRPRLADEPWAQWDHVLPRPAPGRYAIELLPSDSKVRARRLRDGSYVRRIAVGR